LKYEPDNAPTNGLRSRIADLITTRDQLWKLLTEKSVARRNIYETVKELLDGTENIMKWCSEFLTYVSEAPINPNTQKIQEQYIEQYHRFTCLRVRANFLIEHANMKNEVNQVMSNVDNHLANAKTALNNLEVSENQ
jgi:hypothetical protein